MRALMLNSDLNVRPFLHSRVMVSVSRVCTRSRSDDSTMINAVEFVFLQNMVKVDHSMSSEQIAETRDRGSNQSKSTIREGGKYRGWQNI